MDRITQLIIELVSGEELNGEYNPSPNGECPKCGESLDVEKCCINPDCKHYTQQVVNE